MNQQMEADAACERREEAKRTVEEWSELTALQHLYMEQMERELMEEADEESAIRQVQDDGMHAKVLPHLYAVWRHISG